MACQFSATWRTLTNDSASQVSSHLNINHSMFHFFSTVPISQSKRQRFITFSLDPSSDSSSPSSSSCSTSQSASIRQIRTKNSHEFERTHYGIFDINHGRDSNTFEKKETEAHKQNFSYMGLKPLARKKPFWRKILFASNKFRSIILLNVITVVYASDIPVVKGVEAYMDPAAFSAVRFVMSAIPFLPFVFQARDDVKTRNAGIELGFWISLAYVIEAIGLLTSDAGRASFISLFTVIAVPLFDGMLGAVIPARTWFGVLMSALGVAMLECSGSPPNVCQWILNQNILLGDLLNFLSAIFFGIHMLRTEHISRSTKKEDFLALLGYEVCVVAVISMMWLLIGGCFDGDNNFNLSTWTWTELLDWIVAFPWMPALYTGLFSTGFCSLIEISAMRDVSATKTALIYGLEPVWGAGFAWFLLGERWGTLGWIGATFVLGGSLIVQMFGSSPTKKSIKAQEVSQKCDLLMVPHKQMIENGLSTSPVVVRSGKDVIDILK